jgi:DNA-binding transcriptional MerR regulator
MDAQTGGSMKDHTGGETPKDSEKQGYKFLLDTLRDQLLKPKTIEEEEGVLEEQAPIAGAAATVEFPEGKKYFRIGEVAVLIGVEAYVLRYWESEFGSIRPKKSRSGQRIYDRRDVQQLATVHHLLHVEKFSLQGAKQKMIEMRRSGQNPGVPPVNRKVLKDLTLELKSLVALIKRGPYGD